ncbi:hypothetical protein MHLP_03695 [Candidatus Mycoplasma haematolamae str. Purdue]|uniref:Uncharacterized protein n=1 Tax=Mycoplasma haematolamae (strain Purdue) TaxID=1212765 RepID=I7CK97_MYCHA|nr:hypothetical protein MHLP_03695 [Candidatus Mycoplasma haematolamae str. Purdue]
MSVAYLWLKGLSAQGKIYLATSSLAIGSGITGTLAVDSTRDSIWQGVSYVSSAASNLLGQAFKVGNAPPRQLREFRCQSQWNLQRCLRWSQDLGCRRS